MEGNWHPSHCQINQEYCEDFNLTFKRWIFTDACVSRESNWTARTQIFKAALVEAAPLLQLNLSRWICKKPTSKWPVYQIAEDSFCSFSLALALHVSSWVDAYLFQAGFIVQKRRTSQILHFLHVSGCDFCHMPLILPAPAAAVPPSVSGPPCLCSHEYTSGICACTFRASPLTKSWKCQGMCLCPRLNANGQITKLFAVMPIYIHTNWI